MSEEQILLRKSYTDYEISVKRIFGCLEIAFGLTEECDYYDDKK